MIIRYLSIAELELDSAIAYYESQEIGLGIRFYAEIRNTEDRILLFPEAWYPLSENTKRCRTKVFPYGLIYQICDKEIVVIAVANLHKNPDYCVSL